VFLCNLAIGLATLLTVRRLVGEQRGPAGGRLDVAGALTVTGGLAALVYGLSQVPAQGAGAPAVLASLALAGGLLAAFVVVEARAPAPLVPPSLLRVRGVAGANVVMLLGSAVVVAQAVFISLFLRQVLGDPPFVTSLALLPSALTVMVVSNLVPRQLPRFGARALLVVAGGLLAAGMALYTRLPVDASYPQVLTGALPAAAGLGSAIVAVTIVATTGVRPEQQGITAGVLTTAQQVGGAIGVAILASIAAARTEQLALTQPPVAALHGGFQLAFTVASGLALASAAVAALVIPARAGAEPPAGRRADPALPRAARRCHRRRASSPRISTRGRHLRVMTHQGRDRTMVSTTRTCWRPHDTDAPGRRQGQGAAVCARDRLRPALARHARAVGVHAHGRRVPGPRAQWRLRRLGRHPHGRRPAARWPADHATTR
jgi:hypothetical protein